MSDRERTSTTEGQSSQLMTFCWQCDGAISLCQIYGRLFEDTLVPRYTFVCVNQAERAQSRLC